jgi:hypothetical protein
LAEYRNKSWPAIEPAARQLWEKEQDRPWAEFREIVREAWAETRPQFSDRPVSGPLEEGYTAAFHRHYWEHYENSGHEFNDFEPAYALGFDLAVDHTLKEAVWADVEAPAESYWEKNVHSLYWDAVREAAHFAWNEVRRRDQLNDVSLPRRAETIKPSDEIDRSALDSFPASDPPAWAAKRDERSN